MWVGGIISGRRHGHGDSRARDRRRRRWWDMDEGAHACGGAPLQGVGPRTDIEGDARTGFTAWRGTMRSQTWAMACARAMMTSLTKLRTRHRRCEAWQGRWAACVVGMARREAQRRRDGDGAGMLPTTARLRQRWSSTGTTMVVSGRATLWPGGGAQGGEARRRLWRPNIQFWYY